LKRLEYLIEMKGIVKTFPPNVIANDNVYFNLRPGEIHVLLGENGAGKSTLVKILYGVYSPDKGEIYFKGRKVHIKNPRDALKLGIVMVHQYPQLIDDLTVAENIALSIRDLKPISSIRKISNCIKELSRKYDIKIDPNKPTWQLSYTQKQLVEILKALIINAQVIIFDEATTLLPSQDKDKLYKFMKKMAREGKGIILITHKLKEALHLADRITIMRRGRVVAVVKPSEVNIEMLSKLMFNGSVTYTNNSMVKRVIQGRKDIVMKVEGVYVRGDHGGLAVRNVSFNLFKGEILGIAGITGNGQKELIEALMGLRKIEQGRVEILGEDVTRKPPRIRLKLGVAFIPENALKQGVILDANIAENLILKSYYKEPFSKGLVLNFEVIEEWSKKIVKYFNIVTPGIKEYAKHLSGGNIQKLVIAREFTLNPRIVIAVNPTRNLDEYSAMRIRNLFINYRNHGVGILLVSEDLEEVISLSDRVMVMYNGEIVGVVNPRNTPLRTIELMMVMGTAKI